MGRRKGKEEPKCIEISEAPRTSEIWIQLPYRQRKLNAMGPPECQPSVSSCTAPLGDSAGVGMQRAHLSADYRSPHTVRNVPTVLQTKLLPFKNHANVLLMHVLTQFT